MAIIEGDYHGSFPGSRSKKMSKIREQNCWYSVTCEPAGDNLFKKIFWKPQKNRKTSREMKNCTVQFQSLLNIQRLKMQILIKWTFAFYLPKCRFNIPEAYRHMNVHLLYATEMTILKCLFMFGSPSFVLKKGKHHKKFKTWPRRISLWSTL